jgi:hypothetical protein
VHRAAGKRRGLKIESHVTLVVGMLSFAGRFWSSYGWWLAKLGTICNSALNQGGVSFPYGKRTADFTWFSQSMGMNHVKGHGLMPRFGRLLMEIADMA